MENTLKDKQSNDSLLSSIQKQNYTTALAKVLSYQRRDGSWGRSLPDRITYTSHGIQLLLALGVDYNDPLLKKATRWMEDNVKCGGVHWATRLEVGLKSGDYERLFKDKYIKSFLDDLDYDLNHPDEEDRLDFFWHVIPTLIALEPFEQRYERQTGKIIPHDRVIERIMRYSETFGSDNDRIAISNHPNHTGLIALYLSKVSLKDGFSEHRNKAIAMTNWLLETRTNTPTGINWSGSKSVTAYVLIDLIECLPYDELKPYIPKLLAFLIPKDNGRIVGDMVTTYETKLHSESLYATMVVLRAITLTLKEYNTSEYINGLETIKQNKGLMYYYKASAWINYYRSKFPLVTCLLLISAAIITYIYKYTTIFELIASVAFSSILFIFFEWSKKND